MKTSRLIFVSAAAGLAGAALVGISNSALLASLPGEKMIALAVGLAVTAFGIYDYSRRVEPLAAPALLLRPSLPAAAANRECSNPDARTAA